MTDRGAASDLSSVACPFVAFEDDRDVRGVAPDHRHRCYAEVRPAPRALAHQERYCLSAGFATCPTFIDWARREAARVRPGAAPTAAASSGVVASAAAPDDDGSRPPLPPIPAVADDVASMVDEEEVWPRRQSGRDWAAPPPWGASTAAAAGVAAGSAGGDAGAFDDGVDEVDDAEAPAFLATREPPPSTLQTSTSSAARPSPEIDDDGEAEPPMRRFGPAAGRTRYDDTTTPPPPPRRRPVSDPAAPSWEQPRRVEAYPTLRTRAGLPNMSPLLLGAAAVVIGAVALFILPSFLLDLGGGGGGSSSPTPSATVAASATPSPSLTPVPSPTPQTYVVKSGDTLSKIAATFGVSLDDLIAANKTTLPNPDKIKVGDEIIIPAPPASDFTSEPSPSPS